MGKTLEHSRSRLGNELSIGRGKPARRAYGFDEIALVPGSHTLDPELCDISTRLGDNELSVPILASAMDSVVDVKIAGLLGKLGGLGVLNLQGIQTRYEDCSEIYEEITSCDKNSFVTVMQKLYSKPINEELVGQRVAEIKAQGVLTAASLTPNAAEQYAPAAIEAGLDILFIQSTVTGIEHRSQSGGTGLDLSSFCKKLNIPVVVGNCVSYTTALELMDTGVSGILVGVGPGAACTSRGVLGIGVPMGTAISDCRAAASIYAARKKKAPMIIADGGMVTSGDVCKAIACGADAVMIGSPIAKAKEAPGRGYHWGMATPSPVLPRGTRISVGTTVSLKQIINGPADVDDGSQNLTGALRTS
ncbi:MAG: GuaB3 family IMP dehydrogenase-related protein, partial [Candidatus Obscuribacterales bacterium]|nr:GuaB3 family IMP dehydrogenase-related protein [Candidatus Obscuribacterales bacterium]